MRFDQAIDQFLRDRVSDGRLTSDRSVVSYRNRLDAHAIDVGNRDPSKTGREDVKRTLARWDHPNTKLNARSILVSFYDWTMEEGLRETNPARQTTRPRKRPVSVYRLTREECVRLMATADAGTQRERRIIYLGLLVGARNAELRGLQRRHFERIDNVWISPDIAKGGKGRYVPVLPELEPIVADILRLVRADEYVIPARRSVGGLHQEVYREVATKPCSAQSVLHQVTDIGKRAGIAAHLHPHLLRHAFGDHIVRYAGGRCGQALLGHASIETTLSTYTGGPSLDELAVSVSGFAYGVLEGAEIPLKAPSGIEPEDGTPRDSRRDS